MTSDAAERPLDWRIIQRVWSYTLPYRRLLQVFSHTARVRPSEDNSYGSIGLAVKSGKSAAPTAKMHPRRRCRLMAVTLRWTERWMGTGIFGCSKLHEASSAD